MYRVTILTALLLVGSCARMELRRAADMSVGSVSIASIPDGTYTGSHTVGGFTYSVRATVTDGRVDKIKILSNKDTRRGRLAEPVVRRVVEQQKLNVEPIVGAEGTSKALLKACERALSKGAERASE